MAPRVPLRRAVPAWCLSGRGVDGLSLACRQVARSLLGPRPRTRGARRCYIGASTSWAAHVSYGVHVDEPGFDDPGPLVPRPVSRVRRALTVAILLTLVVAMSVLAFTSGRGVVIAPPQEPSSTALTVTTDASRLAVIDSEGGLSTTDAVGGSVVHYGDADVDFSFPAWSPDGSRIAVIGERPDDTGIYVFAPPDPGSTPADPLVVYRSPDHPPFYLYWSPDGQALTFLTREPAGLALRIVPADASRPAVAIRDGEP